MQRLILAGLALLAASASAVAADYPERTITLVVPIAAGGGVDTGSRTWAPHVERCLGTGQPIVVVNMPGGGSVIGFNHIAGQPADGYTLGILVMSQLAAAIVSDPRLKFTTNSFEYLGNFYGQTHAIAVREDSEFKTFDDLLAKSKAGAVNIGSSGVGSDDFLMASQLAQIAGGQIAVIPLNGTAALIPGVLGGHVDAGSMTMSTILSNKGKLRPLASATPERVPEFPNIPTLREKGIDIVSASAHIIGAPKGLPPEIRAKLLSCIEKVRTDPSFLADSEKRKMPFFPMKADEARSFVNGKTEQLKELWTKHPWL